MNKIKKLLLSAGLGQRYFDYWWHNRCTFDPIPLTQMKRGFYFVHIPKTAGTSVLNALGVEKLPYTHCPAHIIQNIPKVKESKLYFFAVTRNPYDRFASSYKYITKRSDWPEQRRFAHDVIGDLSFTDFTKKMAHDQPYRRLITGYEFFFPQSYFTHRRGQRLIDDHLRFEALESDFETHIRSRFPEVKELPSLRDHGGGRYREMYDDKSRQLVQDIYQEDFEHFGYAD